MPASYRPKIFFIKILLLLQLLLFISNIFPKNKYFQSNFKCLYKRRRNVVVFVFYFSVHTRFTFSHKNVTCLDNCLAYMWICLWFLDISFGFLIYINCNDHNWFSCICFGTGRGADHINWGCLLGFCEHVSFFYTLS